MIPARPVADGPSGDLPEASGSIPWGFRAEVARSTLAEANESRDWGIDADWA